MERVLLLSLFAMSIMNAAEVTEQKAEWEKFIKEAMEHEDPPFVAPPFCNTQQFSKAVNAMIIPAGFKKSEKCTSGCPQVIRDRFLVYCSCCAQIRMAEEKKKK